MTKPDTAIIPFGAILYEILTKKRLRESGVDPATELLPVSLVPLLHWTLAEVVDADLQRAIVVTNPAKPILGEVARAFERPGFRVELVSQDRPAGLGDAMLRARASIGDCPFAVVLPDNLFRGPNQTAAVLAEWHRVGLAPLLVADITSGDAG